MVVLCNDFNIVDYVVKCEGLMFLGYIGVRII